MGALAPLRDAVKRLRAWPPVNVALTASVRASTALYNTTDEVDVFLDALTHVRPFFGVGA